MRRLVLLSFGLVGLSACSTILPAGRGPLSPAGQTVQVVAANGARSQMRFARDGRVTATFGDRAIRGDWNVQQEGLCFRWTGAEIECWPYVEPFRRGESRTVTSTRGNVVQVTAL